MSHDVWKAGRRALAVSLMLLGCQAAAVKSNGDGVAGERDPQPGGAPTGSGAMGGGLAIPDGGGGAPSAPQPEPQSCATQIHTANSVPLDLLLLVDASGSMDEMSGAARKWDLTKLALRAFLEDPASAELGVGLSLFPGSSETASHACNQDSDCADVIDDTTRACRTAGVCYAPGVPILPRPCAVGLVSPFNCPAGMQCRRAGLCSQSARACVEMGQPCDPGNPSDLCQLIPGACRTRDEGCMLAPFATLDVDIGDLPAQTNAVVSALAAREPDGATPLTSAADSALTVLERRLQSHPERRSALIMATDGLPGGCGTEQNVDGVANRLERARAAMPGIPTYVVGVFAEDEIARAQPALERFATVGGTGAPFILQTGDDLAMRLLEALKEIRGQAVACEYTIPAPQGGSLDFGKVNVRTNVAGTSVDLDYVGSADRCAPDKGGWYYDTAPTAGAQPRRVILCPQTCAQLRDDPAARVDLVFGCATRGIE